MKDKTLRSQVALVFCGHGSSSKLYKLDFLNFINKIKQKFPNNKIFYCFIEKDSPMIKDCLSEIYFKFSKIIIIPLLLIASLSIHVIYKLAFALPVVLGLSFKFDR